MPKPKRRRWLIALVVLVVVVLLPIAGAGLLALTYDPNNLKPRIAAAIQQATGRTVALDGPIHIGLSLRPTLEVEGMKLGDAPGFPPVPMATLDKVQLRLALFPLLHRQIEIDQVDLVRPMIALRIDANGHDNWHFERPPAPASTQPGGATARPPTLRISAVRIDDGAVTLTDARTGSTFGLAAVQLMATQADPDGPLHIEGTGNDAAMPVAVSGELGPPRAQFLPLDIAFRASGASLTIKGRPQQFALAGDIPDLAALSPLAGQPLPALRDLTFHTDIAAAPGGVQAGLVLHGLRLASPLGDVEGDAAIAPGKPLSVQAVLTAHNLDPAALLAAMPARQATAAATAAAPQPAAAPAPASSAPGAPAPASASWLISDRPLPFPALSQLNADLTFTLQDTKAGAATIPLVSTHTVLRAGHLVLDPLAMDTPAGHVDATATADAAGGLAVSVQAPSLSIQKLLAAFDQPDGVLGTLELRGNLHASGATPHALVTDLNGAVGVALVNGEIDNRLLVALLSRVAPEAGLLDVGGKPGRSPLRCVALRADLTHGVADMHALLLETMPLRLTGGGSLDLGQETLSLNLQPLARIGGSGISVPVAVHGSFRAPKLNVSMSGGGKDAGLTGIVIGALGADRLIAGAGQTDVCADQLQLARFDQPGPVPTPLPAQEAGKSKLPSLNNLLKQLMR